MNTERKPYTVYTERPMTPVEKYVFHLEEVVKSTDAVFRAIGEAYQVGLGVDVEGRMELDESMRRKMLNFKYEIEQRIAELK